MGRRQPDRMLTATRSLSVLLLIILLAGLLRLPFLGTKPLGGDEIYSALRISGSSFGLVKQQLADGEPHPATSWQAHLTPRPGRTASDMMRVLAQEAPEHPPLFFLAARSWRQIVGASLSGQRLLPALFGLLLIPATAALAWELWGNRRTSLLAATAIALSPFHTLYAAELRQYSLWALLLVGCTWALVRAERLHRRRDWLIYCMLCIALLYTHLFSVFPVAGFALLPLLLPPWRKRWRALTLASLTAFLAFSPWLWAAAHGAMLRQGTNLWTGTDLPFPLLLWNWGLNLARLWIDLDPGGRLITGDGIMASVGRLAIVVTATAATAWAFAILIRRSDHQPAAILITLLGCSVLPLILTDLSMGGCRSAIARYSLPAYLAVQLAVVGGLASHPSNRSQPPQGRERWNRLAALILAGWLLLNLCSQLKASVAPGWWSKLGNIDQTLVAHALHQTESPLIVSEGYLLRLLSFSQALPKGSMVLILPSGDDSQRQSLKKWVVPAIDRKQTVVLYRPSPEVLSTLELLGIDSFRETLRTPSRYPYLPHVNQHTRQWLTEASRKAGDRPESQLY